MEGNMKPTRYFSRDEASEYLKNRGFKIAKQTLAKYAVTGGGPIYRNFGTRVVYDPLDLDAWVEARLTARRRSTSEVSPDRSDGEPLRQAAQDFHGTLPNGIVVK
jgi:hypothetical protein